MKIVSSIVFILMVFISCSEPIIPEDGDNNNSTPKPTLEIAINPAVKFQKISGFGGANRMWGTQFLKPAEAVKAFSLDGDGLGLSLFRVRIPSDVAEWPLIVEACKEAQKYGVKIFASPWSPPASLKSNKSDIGGHLLPDNYGRFKDHINDYITFMKDNGVEIDAVSIQNEPDIKVSYESCDWTLDEMSDFIRLFGDSIVGAKLAAPESFNFNENYVNNMLQNPEVVNKFDIVAGHIYGNGQRPFPIAVEKGKEIWMTEYLLNLNVGSTGANWSGLSEVSKWEESLEMLNTVHNAMSNNWNAYIWWYLQRFYSFIGDGEQGTGFGTVLKRGQAFSHFSKYVRPGATRIEILPAKATSLKMTAYDDGSKVVVQILNLNNSAVKNISLSGSGMTKAKTITTSFTLNRLIKELTMSEGKANLDAPEKSITTIVFEK